MIWESNDSDRSQPALATVIGGHRKKLLANFAQAAPEVLEFLGGKIGEYLAAEFVSQGAHHTNLRLGPAREEDAPNSPIMRIRTTFHVT